MKQKCILTPMILYILPINTNLTFLNLEYVSLNYTYPMCKKERPPNEPNCCKVVTDCKIQATQMLGAFYELSNDSLPGDHNHRTSMVGPYN